MEPGSRQQRGDQSRRELRAFLAGGKNATKQADPERVVELVRWWTSFQELPTSLRGSMTQVEQMASTLVINHDTALSFEIARIIQDLSGQLDRLAEAASSVEAPGPKTIIGNELCERCNQEITLRSDEVRSMSMYYRDCLHCQHSTVSSFQLPSMLHGLLAPNMNATVQNLEIVVRVS